ncbi:cytochrome P450, partial [Podospora fimiseda]
RDKRFDVESGPVVRVSPEEVSFNTPSSFRDIYAFRKGHQVFVKTESYNAAAFTAQARSIVNERDPVEHTKMKKMLGPAFAERSVREQWPLIQQLVEGFVVKLKSLAKEGNRKPVDLVLLLSLITFDISTSLALGESFDAVKAGKRHPWHRFFMNGARAMGEGVALGKFPWLKNLMIAWKPPQMKQMIKELRMHEQFCIEMVKKRLASPSDRPDILNFILKGAEQEGEKYETDSIAAQLSDVVIAGAETSSVALSTANYFLLRNPDALGKLHAEIRGTFQRDEDITISSTQKLEYLNAVINEAMRLMAPVPWPLTRLVPSGGDTVDGYHLPAGTWVSTNTFATARSPDNFRDAAEFKAERWLAKDSSDNLDASQPFSLGTRVCIGKQVGLIQLRIIMAKLHFNFDIEAVDNNLDWIRDTDFRLLWDKPAMNVYIKERNAV